MAGMTVFNGGWDVAQRAVEGRVPFVGKALGGTALHNEAANGGFSKLLEQAKSGAAPRAAEDKHKIDPKNLSGDQKKLYEACEELETFLIKNMLSGMRKTVTKSKLVDTGYAGEIYEDMLWDEYAKEYTKQAEFGLAELAYRELNRREGYRP
jgi:flagellar protein FlgJ